ncbi:MAG: class I SAM-dependent methyltransferase [Bacteroidota bacterium]
MFEFHGDKKRYFDYQYKTSKEYILPYVKSHLGKQLPLRVLEIGCGEAGVLKAFTDEGHECVGIELGKSRVELAEKFLEKEISEGKISFITKNIYDIDLEREIGEKFDLIILKDVIEHIHEQERLIPQLRSFLRDGGKIFFAFPPWYMPFGGHQQVCKSKFLSKLPYFHLLPAPLYRLVLRLFGETPRNIESLMEIKETGISIERFESIAKRNYQIIRKTFFLINPIYKYKFKLQPREQWGWVASLPFLRNFFTTAVYYLIEAK